MSADRWHLTLAGLLGQPWPALPVLPGVVHVCRDAPLSTAELAGVTSPSEPALLCGISRQAAHKRLHKQIPTTREPAPARPRLHQPPEELTIWPQLRGATNAPPAHEG